LAVHVPELQLCVVWHAPVLVAVQATHWPVAVSQTWWAESHAAQSAFLVQVTSGAPVDDVGQVADVGMQVPALEHVCPVPQPLAPVALHATHECSESEHVVMLSEQAAQSVLLLQL
jgi:hypothetical protein